MDNLDYRKVEEGLVSWLKDRVSEAGAKGAVIGLSGGIDSAVTAVLCQKAFGENVLGLIMPCYSNKKDAEDAILLAETFNINYLVKDLGPVLDELLVTIKGDYQKEQGNLAIANLKPRLRMISLYYYAASNNYLVVGTDNWSELKVGYFTKYGDGGIDLAPLGRLVKTEVRGLARHLGIPEPIIKKAPSAGLWGGQTDEQEMGLSYEVLDQYILTGEAEKGQIERIEELASKNAHKLKPIPIPDRELLIK